MGRFLWLLWCWITMDKRVAHRTWVQQVAVPELDVGIGAPFKDAVFFDLKPGAYRLIVQIKDIHAEASGRCDAPLQIPGLRASRRTGVQRFATIFSCGAKRGSPSVCQAGLEGRCRILPEIMLSESRCRFILRSIICRRRESVFIMGYRLIDAEGVVVRTYPAKRFLKPGESCVRAEVLDTEGLREGTYDLQVEAFDGSSRQYFQTRRPIFLVSKDLPEGLTQVQRDLIRYYADIRYVADEKTRRTYGVLESWPARLAFLKVFWKQLDDAPDTPTNERLLQHLMRMHYVETHFGAGVRGSDTDRGRVYIQYGPPDDIDYRTSAAGHKPSEVWFYETHRRYEFVFRDRRGTGVYELVHSSYPGGVVQSVLVAGVLVYNLDGRSGGGSPTVDLPLRRKGSALPQSLLPSDDRMGSQEYWPRYARRSFGWCWCCCCGRRCWRRRQCCLRGLLQ